MTRDTDIERIADALIDVHSGPAPWPGPMTSTQFAERLYDAGLRPSVEPAGLTEAWRQAEAALPEGYALTNMANLGTRAWPRWYIVANETPADVLTVITGEGPTFAAALRALAAALPTQASDSPEKP